MDILTYFIPLASGIKEIILYLYPYKSVSTSFLLLLTTVADLRKA